MFALLTGVSGAWAIDVVVSDQTNLNTITNSNFSTTAAHKYGTYSAPAGGTTFTTNSTSGLSGVTITSTSNIVKPFYYSGGNYKYGLAFKPSDGDTYTITISAPENYVIVGYTMKAISTTSNQQFEVVASSGTYTVSSSQNYITGRVGNEKSTTFTLKNKKNNASTYDAELCLPFFTITVLPADASSLKATNVSDISKSKTYLVHSIDYSASDKSRGYLSATSGYLACTSKTGNWAPSSFAFVQYDGKYFLYDVANKKFVRTENYSSNSNEVKGIETNTSILPVTLEKISDGTFKIKMGVNFMNFSGSYTYGITINYYTTNDAGNNLEIIENGSFDDTEAIATLEAYLANPTIVNGGKYKIKLNGTNYYVSKDASGNAKTEETASELIISENGTNAAGKKAYSIKDAGTNKYLSYTDITYSNGHNSRLSWADTDANSKFVFTQGSGTYSSNVLFRPADACDNNYVTSWNQNYSDQDFVFWTISNTMSYWTLEKVTKTVTYNLKWNGSKIKTNSSVSAHIGDAAADYIPWDVPAYSDFTCDVATIGESTTEVNVTMTWDGPFDFSTDFENANWYYLKMHGQYLINSGGTSCYLADLATAETAGYNAFWAFVGDPLNGFQMINKAAGSDKNLVVSVSSWTPYMGDGETKLLLQVWNDNFALRTSNFHYLNNADGTLKLWVSGTSAEEMHFDCSVESPTYRGRALAYLDEYANSHALGQYFGVSTESYNYLRNSYAEAESVSAEDYTLLESNISACLSPKLPETGYYRIKSSGSRGDQSYITYGYLDGSKGIGLLTTIGNKETDLGTVVKLTRVGTGKNYKISIQGLNVQAHSGDNTLFRATGAEGQNFQFNHINFSGMCSIYDGTNHGNMHEAGWKKQDTGLNGVVGWDAGDGTNASSWCLEDASTIEVTLNNGGDGFYYATCFTDFPVSYTGASNGEGLFVLTGGESNGKVTAQKVAAVPAQQGFLIRIAAENVTDSKVTLTIPASADALAGENILTGTCLATTKPDGNVYVFSKVEDDLGFFPYTGTDIPANRAYIVESDGNVRSFILSFDDTTGINGVSTSMPAGTIFDMQGRRVNKAEKGLYIVNGKKVLF